MNGGRHVSLKKRGGFLERDGPRRAIKERDENMGSRRIWRLAGVSGKKSGQFRSTKKGGKGEKGEGRQSRRRKKRRGVSF